MCGCIKCPIQRREWATLLCAALDTAGVLHLGILSKGKTPELSKSRRGNQFIQMVSCVE